VHARFLYAKSILATSVLKRRFMKGTGNCPHHDFIFGP
jgi:hypothetical protein